MGVWGPQPGQSDAALDFAAKLRSPSMSVFDWIEKGLKSDCYDERRVAADVMVKLEPVYDIDRLDDHFCLALERLRDIRDDDEWIASWNVKDHIMHTLYKQIAEVEAYFAKSRRIKETVLSRKR